MSPAEIAILNARVAAQAAQFHEACVEAFIAKKLPWSADVLAQVIDVYRDSVEGLIRDRMAGEAVMSEALERDAAHEARITELQAYNTAEVERRRKAEACVASIATMLGWGNVPPQQVLEGEIRALKARVLAADEADLRREVPGVVLAVAQRERDEAIADAAEQRRLKEEHSASDVAHVATIRKLRAALAVAAAKFREYEALHLSKIDTIPNVAPIERRKALAEEYCRKASANAEMAVACEAALAGPEPDDDGPHRIAKETRAEPKAECQEPLWSEGGGAFVERCWKPLPCADHPAAAGEIEEHERLGVRRAGKDGGR